jgi:hypothetical protein
MKWKHQNHPLGLLLKKRGIIFQNNARKHQRTTPSPFDEVPVITKKREQYIPPSPIATERRSLQRLMEHPTCLVIGQLREMLNPDHFFDNTCKLYEDTIYANPNGGRVNQNSHRFRCTANHISFCLPSDRKKIQKTYHRDHIEDQVIVDAAVEDDGISILSQPLEDDVIDDEKMLLDD